MIKIKYLQRTPPVLHEPLYAGAASVRGSGGPGEPVDVYDADTRIVLGTGLIGKDGAFTAPVSPTLQVDQRIQAHSDNLDSNVVVVQAAPVTEIPEPASLILVGVGLFGLWAVRQCQNAYQHKSARS